MNKLKKGDKVQILLGKDRKKSGSIERVLVKAGRVYVSGVNLFKRHVKGQQGVEGGIIEIPKSMDISDVALICPNCNKPTRVGFKIEGKTKVRICRKCKKEIGGK